MSKCILLTQGKFAIVDADMYDELSRYKWYASEYGSTYYALRHIPKRRNANRSIVYMHRQIMNAQPKEQIDHKDTDGLNNRLMNLRFCNSSQNHANTIAKIGGTSKYKGVYWRKDRHKWQAQIRGNKQVTYLGIFDSETKAAKAYDVAAIKYFAEFARTNF